MHVVWILLWIVCMGSFGELTIHAYKDISIHTYIQQDKEMSVTDSCCGVDWTLGGLLLVTGPKSLISDPLKPPLPLLSFSL